MKKWVLVVGLLVMLCLGFGAEVQNGKVIRTRAEKDSLKLQLVDSMFEGASDDELDYIVGVEGDAITIIVPGSPPPKVKPKQNEFAPNEGKSRESVVYTQEDYEYIYISDLGITHRVEYLNNIGGEAGYIEGVPRMQWSHGCYATTGTMLAAYYDRNGFPDIYTGPENNGVFPLDTSVWGRFNTAGEGTGTMVACPLTSTMLGLEGRTERGHFDDYWAGYGTGSSTPDPYMVGGWEEHEPDCVADFMGTNQYKYSNADGATIAKFQKDGLPWYKPPDSGTERFTRDGMTGLSLFLESKGYESHIAYTQIVVPNIYSSQPYSNRNTSVGFTFDDYVNEINNNRPVMILVAGHAVLGVGYFRSPFGTRDKAICYDTWYDTNHVFDWGGYLSDLAHYGVAVMHLSHNQIPESGNQRVDFHLHDSWGDGWSSSATGKSFIDFQGYQFSLMEGGTETHSFNLKPDTTYTYSFLETGPNGSDASWAVKTAMGTLLSRGHGTGFHGSTQEFEFYLPEQINYDNVAVPQNIALSVDSGDILITWDPVTTDQYGNNISGTAIRYLIYRGENPEVDMEETTPTITEDTHYRYTMDPEDKDMYWRIGATANIGTGIKPENITASVALGKAELRWDAVGNSSLYSVYICDNPEFSPDATIIVQTAETSYDFDITDNKLKFFRVSAYIE